MNVDIQTIIDATGLTKEEIEKLQSIICKNKVFK